MTPKPHTPDSPRTARRRRAERYHARKRKSQKACRLRRKAGLAVLRVEVDLVGLEEMLLANGLTFVADDRASLERALTHLISDLIVADRQRQERVEL